VSVLLVGLTKENKLQLGKKIRSSEEH